MHISSETIIKTVKRIAKETVSPFARTVDSDMQYPRNAMDALRDTGLLGLTIPKEHGGLGQNISVACEVIEELAKACGSTAMVYLMHLCGVACYLSSAKPLPILTEIALGRHLTTLAWSERGSRSHFWAPTSYVTTTAEVIVFSADKTFVTAAKEADSFIVSSRTSQASATSDTWLFYVKKTDTGILHSGEWRGMGMRGNGSNAVIFKECEIPRERALCPPGSGLNVMMQVVLPLFSLGVSSICTGLCEASTTDTLAHITATSFEEIDQKLADVPLLRARVAKMRTLTDAAKAHLHRSLKLALEESTDAPLQIMECKAFTSEIACIVTKLAMTACGGAAYSGRLPIERRFREAQAVPIMAPTTDVLYDLIGRTLCNLPLL
jgi:alkylation response protein AidB-like acyl-CoA dehydrogenase